MGFTLVCDTDKTTFKGMEPKVVFARTQTIGEGADYCNFRYLNGMKEKNAVQIRTIKTSGVFN